MTLEELLKEHEVDIRYPDKGDHAFLWYNGKEFVIQYSLRGEEIGFGDNLDEALSEFLS